MVDFHSFKNGCCVAIDGFVWLHQLCSVYVDEVVAVRAPSMDFRVCVCVCVLRHMRTYIHYIRMCVCNIICIHVCMCVCVYVFTCVCTHVCVLY